MKQWYHFWMHSESSDEMESRVILLISSWISWMIERKELSLRFLVWKFYEKQYFMRSFGRIARNYAEPVTFHKGIKTHEEIRWNYGIFRSLFLIDKCSS